MCKTVLEGKEARLRRKLINNELNPIADILLTIFLLCMSPFIYLFAMVHDKLMFKFLNKIYIYNVSWEVNLITAFNLIQLCLEYASLSLLNLYAKYFIR